MYFTVPKSLIPDPDSEELGTLRTPSEDPIVPCTPDTDPPIASDDQNTESVAVVEGEPTDEQDEGKKEEPATVNQDEEEAEAVATVEEDEEETQAAATVEQDDEEAEAATTEQDEEEAEAATTVEQDEEEAATVEQEEKEEEEAIVEQDEATVQQAEDLPPTTVAEVIAVEDPSPTGGEISIDLPTAAHKMKVLHSDEAVTLANRSTSRDLKTKCKELGLPTQGKKIELAQRIIERQGSVTEDDSENALIVETF